MLIVNVKSLEPLKIFKISSDSRPDLDLLSYAKKGAKISNEIVPLKPA